MFTFISKFSCSYSYYNAHICKCFSEAAPFPFQINTSSHPHSHSYPSSHALAHTTMHIYASVFLKLNPSPSTLIHGHILHINISSHPHSHSYPSSHAHTRMHIYTSVFLKLPLSPSTLIHCHTSIHIHIQVLKFILILECRYMQVFS